jgi:hypothetical protein
MPAARTEPLDQHKPRKRSRGAAARRKPRDETDKGDRFAGDIRPRARTVSTRITKRGGGLTVKLSRIISPPLHPCQPHSVPHPTPHPLGGVSARSVVIRRASRFSVSADMPPPPPANANSARDQISARPATRRSPPPPLPIPPGPYRAAVIRAQRFSTVGSTIHR